MFPNLVNRTITDDEIATLSHFYYGLDFGYDPDPTAFIECALEGRTLYITAEEILRRASSEQIADAIRPHVSAQDLIICDSADPRTIRDLRTQGLDARPVKKGKGSIEYGMKWLRSLDAIIVDPKRTPAAAKEFGEYEHVRLKDGSYTSAYPDKDNHCVDGVRYSLEPVFRRGVE